MNLPKRGAFIRPDGSILWMWDFIMEEKEGAPFLVSLPPRVEEAFKGGEATLVDLEHIASAGELHQTLSRPILEARIIQDPDSREWRIV